MESLNIDSATSLNPASAGSTELKNPNDELEQGDFIELLVAQIKNQDPTKPMDPSQFMNQLTQSSMVNGLNELQKSFDTLATKLSSDQSLQAAGLVGKSVLIPGGQGQLTTGGSISGELSIEGTANSVTLNIYNAQGEQVKTLPLGANKSGDIQFKWDGITDGGTFAPEGHYLVTAEALINGKAQAVEVSLESVISSININKNPDGTKAGTLLNLASGHSVTLDEISRIK